MLTFGGTGTVAPSNAISIPVPPAPVVAATPMVAGSDPNSRIVLVPKKTTQGIPLPDDLRTLFPAMTVKSQRLQLHEAERLRLSQIRHDARYGGEPAMAGGIAPHVVGPPASTGSAPTEARLNKAELVEALLTSRGQLAKPLYGAFVGPTSLQSPVVLSKSSTPTPSLGRATAVVPTYLYD